MIKIPGEILTTEEQQSILKEAKITSEQVATVEGIESQQAVKKEPIIEPQAIQEASQITEPVIEAEAMPIEAISDQVEESNEQPQEGVVIKNNPILFEINELETVATEINSTSTTYNDVEAPSILIDEVAEIKQANVQEPSVAELLNDVQVKHVTIENSTIHIGQLNVEQLPKTEQEVDKDGDEATPLQPIQPFQSENSGSRVPFNVVMLKSDKQKLLTKKFVMEQLHHQQSEEAATEEDDLSVSIQGTNTIVIEAQTPAEQHGELESPQQVVWQEEQAAQVEQVDEAMDTSPIVEQVIFEKDIVNEIINEPNAIVVEPVISEIDSSLLRQSSTPVNAYEQMQQFAQTSVAVETLEREEHLIEEAIEIDAQPEIVKAENVEEDIQQPIIPSDSMIELEAPTTTVQQVQQPVQLEIPVEPEKKY